MTDLEQVFARAASDRRHGASEIERRLVADLLDARRSWTATGLAAGGDALRDGQPAMANLRRLAHRLADDHPAVLGAWLERRSEVLAELDERLARAAWPHVEGAGRVVTISRSSAVAAVVTGAGRRGWRGEVVVLDGSPEGGGADQAAALAGITGDVRSQPDAAAPEWLAGDGVRVLVGADAVSPVRLVNVRGTAALLELAAARSVPAFVVADTGKDLPDDELEELLEAAPVASEEGPGRRWRLFEAAPMSLVTGRIRE